MEKAYRLDISLRRAAPDDLAQIIALIEPFVAQRKLLPRTDEELARLMQQGFVAEHAGRIIGVAAVEVYSRKLAEIQCLAVAADFHGRGIGKRLVESCAARARELNVQELMAITSSEDFLRQCGFDYALPDQKRALFLRTGDGGHP